MNVLVFLAFFLTTFLSVFCVFARCFYFGSESIRASDELVDIHIPVSIINWTTIDLPVKRHLMAFTGGLIVGQDYILSGFIVYTSSEGSSKSFEPNVPD